MFSIRNLGGVSLYVNDDWVDLYWLPLDTPGALDQSRAVAGWTCSCG